MIRTVNNSSRPINIKKERNHLLTSGKCAKLSVGPTFPIAGPTFPRVVATDPSAVVKSTPNPTIIKDPRTKIET